MSDNRIIGEFVSATEPTADELNRLAAFFEKKLNSPVTLKWVEDKSVAKGFILKVLNEVYENTPEGLIKSLKTAVADVRKSDGDYISLVKSAIANWQPKATAEEIKTMRTKCMGPNDMISNLSGGNQQKVIFGKWLEREPQVFMMDEPTRGIDVGAKYEIYELIINMAKQGRTIIVVSSEMPEILGITNRIGVMSNGYLSGIVNTKETNQEELLRLSAKYL